MKISAEDRARAIASMARAASPLPVAPEGRPAFGLRASLEATAALTESERTDLLARAVAREDVRLVVDLMAWEQDRPGADGQPIRNRNNVRFRSGAMAAVGRSGRGTPYLRDHDQRSMAAVGGQIVASKTTKLEGGGYEVHQTALVTEPAAVERHLRGLARNVSIGWRATGPVICTACGTEVFEACWHFPGDVAELKDGSKTTVQWEWTDAELIETSEVAIPAVPTAGIEGIRAAAIAAAAQCSSNEQPGPTPHRSTIMSISPALAAKLGLAATATEAEALAAVEQMQTREREAASSLAILEAEAKIDKSTPVDKFVAAAIAEGKLKPADEGPWRELFALSPDRARARMAERPAGSATPVGQPRQADKPEPTETAAAGGTTRDTAAAAVLAKHGRDHGAAVKFAALFGARNPAADVAKFAAGIKEG